MIQKKVLQLLLVLKVNRERSGPTPLCSIFVRNSGPPGLMGMPGYLAFILASSACTGLAFFSWESWRDDAQKVKNRELYC